MRFLFLTGEYPPYRGGVADYTWQVVHGLRKRKASVEVIVFRESRGPADATVHFVGPAVSPKSLMHASRIIERSSQDCVLLVQYVPQMYGLKGMNLGFVMGLCRLKASTLWVMFHEVHVTAAKGSPWKHLLLASITQNMAQRLAKRADRCFVSISSFGELLKNFIRPGVRVDWLPVPSNLPVDVAQEEVNLLRDTRLQDGAAPLVGHFGTYRGPLLPLLREFVEESRRLHPEWKLVFIGRGSQEFLNDLEEQDVLPPGSAAASGELGSAETACWIKACDIMVQPYPDGASTRRGSLMAALALGKATVSNLGHLSDRFWTDRHGLCIADRPNAGELVAAISRVLGDDELRYRLQADAIRLYVQHFSLERTLQRLEAVTVDPIELLVD